MSKQYNKAEKRQRRQAYLKRRKMRTKAKIKPAAAPASPTLAAEPSVAAA